MTCNSCQTRWCYVCGLKLTDVSGESGSFSSHNQSWNTSNSKCPMYMILVHDHFADWPTDDAAALQRYHRIKTIRLLRSAVREMGRDVFEQLRERYHEVRNCGFTIDDIMNSSVLFMTPGRTVGGVADPGR